MSLPAFAVENRASCGAHHDLPLVLALGAASEDLSLANLEVPQPVNDSPQPKTTDEPRADQSECATRQQAADGGPAWDLGPAARLFLDPASPARLHRPAIPCSHRPSARNTKPINPRSARPPARPAARMYEPARCRPASLEC